MTGNIRLECGDYTVVIGAITGHQGYYGLYFNFDPLYDVDADGRLHLRIDMLQMFELHQDKVTIVSIKQYEGDDVYRGIMVVKLSKSAGLDWLHGFVMDIMPVYYG